MDKWLDPHRMFDKTTHPSSNLSSALKNQDRAYKPVCNPGLGEFLTCIDLLGP